MKCGDLTHEQARFYRNQGYYRLPRVFDEAETKEMRQFVVDQHEPKFYKLYERNPELMDKVVKHPKLIGALTSLLGPNIVYIKNRHNHATVNNHQGDHPEGLHRDILQPTRGLLTAAVYLETSSTTNGATRVIPGSHEWPYVGVPQPNGGGTWMSEHEEFEGLEDQAIQVPMPAGGVLLFNGLVFHGIGANLSGRPRISMTLGFRAVDELDRSPDQAQLLVAGQFVYRGNDQ